MTRHYKVYTNFTNYIPIDETELEKALKSFIRGVGVVFQNGATQRIESIVPDDVKMMGWNEGYKPSPEELGDMSRDKRCVSARRLIADVKDHIALGTNEPFKQLDSPRARIYTQGMTSLSNLLPRKD